MSGSHFLCDVMPSVFLTMRTLLLQLGMIGVNNMRHHGYVFVSLQHKDSSISEDKSYLPSVTAFLLTCL